MDNKNSFWQTERGRALVKLGLWMIFIVVIVIVAIVSESSDSNYLEDTNNELEVNEEVYEFTNYDDMLDALLLGNYEYTYTITNENSKYIYTGWKNETKEIGFREDNTGIIKYYIDGVNVYKVNLDNVEVIDYLYNNIDSSYLSLNNLFDNLSNYLYSVSKNDDVRTITYDKSGYQVIVNTNTKFITNIIITTDTTTYDLEFTKIGECATIDFNI